MTPRHTTKKPAKKKAKVGRPTDYKPEYADQVAAFCAQGDTDADLANRFDVSLTTIKTWKEKHPQFLAALKAGKEEADANVERSLYKRAMGYSHEAVRILTVPQGNNGGSVVEEVPYTEHYPPDATSMIFWLKNRQPDKWREKSEVALTGDFAAMLEAARKRVAHG